ncbi:MAG: hypothetical protein LBO62_04050 [Endomicrobium sp.]|jgi:probable addiction module antidote protein|nr:hypothetical protein [Endomicrobium sp.]
MIKKEDLELTDFWEERAKSLNTLKKIKAYMNAANKAYDETGDVGVLLSALELIAMAKGNISKVAKKSKIARRSVYNLFKKNSNPTLRTLSAVSKNIGVNIHLSL